MELPDTLPPDIRDHPTVGPVLDKISGPMGARFSSSIGLRCGIVIGRALFLQVPALDKSVSQHHPLQLVTGSPQNPGENGTAVVQRKSQDPVSDFNEGHITHLIFARLKYDLYDFFRGCLGPASCSFSCRKGPKTPPKKII